MSRRDLDGVARVALWLSLPAALWLLCLGRIGVLGLDSAHAYWAVWRTGPYVLAPGRPDAFTYSPVVAQVLRPATLLPWPVFLALWSLSLTAALAWLLWPLPARWRWLALLYAVPPAVAIGNVEAWLAVAAVVGLRWAGAWAVPLLTKVTPGLGPVWFAVRREWWRLGVSVGATAALVGVSWAVDPHLWARWLAFLTTSPVPPTQAHYPPLWLRLPVALALTVWAARRSRPQWLVVAMVLAVPLWSSGVLLLLAAVPRARVALVPAPRVRAHVVPHAADGSGDASATTAGAGGRPAVTDGGPAGDGIRRSAPRRPRATRPRVPGPRAGGRARPGARR